MKAMETDTRTRILETTADLLRRHGYHGTGLKDILAESGTPRGSLYYYFPGGKEQLTLEAMLRGIDEVTGILEELMATGDPAGAVRAYAEATAERLEASDFAFGCPVAPIVLDLVGEPVALASACRRALTDWQRALREGFAAAGIAEARSTSLAVTVVSSLEGALILARAQRSTEPMLTVAGELTTLIEAALPR